MTNGLGKTSRGAVVALWRPWIMAFQRQVGDSNILLPGETAKDLGPIWVQ